MTERQRAERDVLAELATLGSLALAAGRARSSSEVASAALDILARSTDADTGVVLFNDGSGFDVQATYGVGPGVVEAIVDDRTIGAQLLAALEATSAPLFVPLTEARMRPKIAASLAAQGLTHILVAPLRASGLLVGLLGLGWRSAPATPPAEATVQHAATVVAASLENARLVGQLQQSLASERRIADEEKALQSLTLIAETAGAFDELAETTIRQVTALVGAVAGSYALLTDDDRVVHSAAIGIDPPFLEDAANRPASQMLSVARLVASGGPYVQDYVEGSVLPHTLEMARERGWTTFAMLPITVRHRMEALIALFFDAPPVLLDADRTLTAIARIASISLSNFRLRERLVSSESRYRVLFEESPDAIILLARADEIIDANPAALRLYRTDLAGLREFAALDEGRIEDAERRRRNEIVTRDGRGVFRDTGRRPDDTTFEEEVEIIRVSIAGESRYLVIVRDLTEQVHLQQELLQAQKMEAIGQLVSGVAHELNNPLAAIVAFSQLIRRDERLPEDMRSDAELLVQEADRTRRIVQNLLDFARQRPPERHPTSIAALVESVLALQSYSLAAGRIDLAVDIPPDLPYVDVDRSQLQQVLLNLTLNAIQAVRAEGSGGHIWITARRVESRNDEVRLRLTVSDDGPGIPEQARSRLFLPFYTTKQPGEGTGLGLSVSFGIVASHGGALRFEPRSGGGAAFIVELPVSSRSAPDRRSVDAIGGARQARTPESSPATAELTTRPKVLVLDDEPSIRAFLTKSLRLARLDPIAVAEGEEAIDRCRSETFAAVLIDHRMPGMSGTEVFEAMVAIRPELGSRFVFMSGDVLNPELREFAATHDVTLLAKPFDVDTVNRLVADVVARPDRGS
jgi:PAS domain S-box-containing protein